MLIEWLLDLISAGMDAALSGLPVTEAPFIEGLTGILANLGALNYFLPISETFAVVIGVLFVFPVFMGATFLVWCVAMIRGGSARG